jgi:dTDP-4-dehydrorhamnose reductase
MARQYRGGSGAASSQAMLNERARLLVTGGSGELGGRVACLAREVWDVTATYLTHPKDVLGVTWHQLDVRDASAVAALVAEVRPAVVIHTAAANPNVGIEFELVNADGTRHIASAAANAGARLVHLSSDVVFDGEQGHYTEDKPPSAITDYGRSKALAEAHVQAVGGEAVIVRTSLIYGWRPQLTRQIRWIVEGLREGRPVWLFTDELRCPVWIESLAAAVIELARLDYVGVLNVAGAQALSRYEFGLRLAQAHGLDPGDIIPASSRDSGQVRPLDCTLDCCRARALLRTPLPGVDEVLLSRVHP